jgi:RHS repeat-associated protein
LDEETGLYYYGARYLNPTSGMWLSADPLFEKYVGMSPYNYCAGNPVKLVDVDGREIEEASMEQWNKFKNDIISKIKELEVNNNSNERLEYLTKSLETMNILEASNQRYNLSFTEDDFGEVKYLKEKNSIELVVGNSTSNFIHELTHAGQYESGDLAFLPNGATILQDVEDEINAYKAQFAYDSEALSLFSTNPKTFKDIDINFLDGLGYGNNNLGRSSISINSNKFDLLRAYSHDINMVGLIWNSEINTARDIPNIIFKNK